MKTILLRDIAKKARVDISTASRALSNSPLVKEETKQKISALAEEMGYYPDALAKGLASKRSQTIGLIVPNMIALQGPFYTEILRGIEQKTNENGYSLLLTTVDGKDRQKVYSTLIKGRKMDGALLINEDPIIAEIPFLIKEKIAFVVVNRSFKEPLINCVASDNAEGEKIATAHLLDLGHKRIGFITGEMKLVTVSERIKGYSQALKEKKVAFNEELVIEGSFATGISSGYECALQLLNMTPKPTAILAGNDEMAVGVFQAAREKKLKIPQDIAVVGFDDTQFAPHLKPALSTVKQYGDKIGVEACGMLIKILNREPLQTNKLKVPTRLIIRDSCGAP